MAMEHSFPSENIKPDVVSIAQLYGRAEGLSALNAFMSQHVTPTLYLLDSDPVGIPPNRSDAVMKLFLVFISVSRQYEL